MSKTYDDPERWTATYLRTKNDVNGNSRRGWAIQKNGIFQTFIADDHTGKKSALETLVRTHGIKLGTAVNIINEALEVTVPPAEFREFVKYGKVVDKAAGR